MDVPRRPLVRAGFALLLVLSAATVAGSFVGADTTTSELAEQGDRPFAERDQLVAPREAVTVVATSPRGSTPGRLAAFAPDGRLLYYNQTYDKYFDIDPVEGRTIEYVAGHDLDRAECPGKRSWCSRVAVERLNLTTGEVTTVHSHYTAHGIWHDVDRINDTHLLVADIGANAVKILNVRTGLVTWQWNAQSAFDIDTGGVFREDWTHLNDVQRLEDGRVMVSVRNQDQVAFVSPDGTMNETIGAEDDHATLYEQHNPDYIPEARGGPAVVVGDSENNRVVEYAEDGGEWERTWVWRDARLQWPRDADRLPNGHTLVTDSDGNRIVEVAENGSAVWSMGIDTPYEAERLGTGSESAGGESARQLGLESRNPNLGGGGEDDGGSASISLLGRVVVTLKGLVPSVVLNGLLFVLPPWVDATTLLVGGFALATAVAWGAVELWWSPWTVDVALYRDDAED